MAHQPALFIGMLRVDCQKADLQRAIFALLTSHLNIRLRNSDIVIKEKANKPRHAFVYLTSKAEVNEVILRLGSSDIRQLIQTDFPVLVGFRFDQHINNNKMQDQHINNNIMQDQHIIYNRMQDQHIKFYKYEQILGNETRDKEFKEAGGKQYVKKDLKDHVCQYLCGFLNSSQAGTLYIGVRDDGKVVGIECDRKKEDDIRLKIDRTIKTIKPTLFPQNYHVDFIPVYQDGQVIADHKVLEISVDKIHEGHPSVLYEAGGQAYIRRDGSIHALTPFEIQEWAKQVHQRELAELKRQKEELMKRDEEREKIESQKRREQEGELAELKRKQKEELMRKDEERERIESQKRKEQEIHQREFAELKRQKSELRRTNEEREEIESQKRNEQEEHQRELAELKRQKEELMRKDEEREKIESRKRKEQEVHQRELAELKRQKEELMRKDEERERIEAQKRKEQEAKDKEKERLKSEKRKRQKEKDEEVKKLMAENEKLKKKQSTICVIS